MSNGNTVAEVVIKSYEEKIDHLRDTIAVALIERIQFSPLPENSKESFIALIENIYTVIRDGVANCIRENPITFRLLGKVEVPIPIDYPTVCEFESSLFKYTLRLQKINSDVKIELKKITEALPEGEEPYVFIDDYIDEILGEELEEARRTGARPPLPKNGAFFETIKKYGIYIAVGLAAIFIFWKKGVI